MENNSWITEKSSRGSRADIKFNDIPTFLKVYSS